MRENTSIPSRIRGGDASREAIENRIYEAEGHCKQNFCQMEMVH